MDYIIIVFITFWILQTRGKVNTGKFVKDAGKSLDFLREEDYTFYAKAKYGEKVDIDKLFDMRIRNGFVGFIMMLFVFITDLTFINIVFAGIVAFLLFKLNYFSLKRYHKKHLHEINMQLPYFLKGLEILIQHYTVPVALSRSIDTAPEIFREGLSEMIAKINSGDSSGDPYMEFARAYPVRDSMRMMRLLYRLSLGDQENKHNQVIMFASSVSALQNKSREQKYKDRLNGMEKRTMIMLVCTGGGVLVILLLSMLMFFQF